MQKLENSLHFLNFESNFLLIEGINDGKRHLFIILYFHQLTNPSLGNPAVKQTNKQII